MSLEGFAHAVVATLLLAGTYLALEGGGLFEGRSRTRRYLIFVPVGLVVMTLLNALWPGWR